MPQLNINWDDLVNQHEEESAKFVPAPAGIYDLEIKKAEPGGNGTKEKVSIQATIVEGPHKGKTVFNDQWISPENPTSMRIFFQNMKAMGVEPDWFRGHNRSTQEMADAVLGAKFQAEVEVNTFNPDRPSNRVKRGIKNLAPGGATSRPSSPGAPRPVGARPTGPVAPKTLGGTPARLGAPKPAVAAPKPPTEPVVEEYDTDYDDAPEPPF